MLLPCTLTLCGGVLHSAGVADTVVAPIAQQLRHLAELQLAGTSVTDAGVVQLTALRQLRRLTAPDASTVTARNLVLSQ
jgi:hypothetical protein